MAVRENPSLTERARNLNQGMMLVNQVMDELGRIRHGINQLVTFFNDQSRNALDEGAIPIGPLPVGTGAVAVVGANPKRRGLSIVNTGATTITLGVGISQPTPGAGIVLSGGQSWDGRISGMRWRGSVSAISNAAGGTIAGLEA